MNISIEIIAIIVIYKYGSLKISRLLKELFNPANTCGPLVLDKVL